MRRRIRPFLLSACGATALEFAFVAPLFLSLVFSSLEGGWYMTKSLLLDRAVSRTVRLMRVADKNAPATLDDVKRAICKEAMIFTDCVNLITVEMTKIRTATDFPSTELPCTDRSLSVKPVTTFTPGARSDIMYIRACVVADPFMPGLGFALALPKDGKGGYNLRSAGAS